MDQPSLQIVLVGPLYREQSCVIEAATLRAPFEYLAKSWSTSWVLSGSAINSAFRFADLAGSCTVIGAWDSETTAASDSLPSRYKDSIVLKLAKTEESGRSLSVRMLNGQDALFITEVAGNRRLKVGEIIERLPTDLEGTVLLLCGFAKMESLHSEVGTLIELVRHAGGKVALDTGRLEPKIEPNLRRVLRRTVESVVPSKSYRVPNRIRFKATMDGCCGKAGSKTSGSDHSDKEKL
jgi:hypothetical protein